MNRHAVVMHYLQTELTLQRSKGFFLLYFSRGYWE